MSGPETVSGLDVGVLSGTEEVDVKQTLGEDWLILASERCEQPFHFEMERAGRLRDPAWWLWRWRYSRRLRISSARAQRNADRNGDDAERDESCSQRHDHDEPLGTRIRRRETTD